MEPSRADTSFNVRYAARVLERHACLWRRLDASVRVMALLAGSGAIGAIGAEHAGWAVGLGVVFAVFQAVEFALHPAEVAAKSLAQRRQYAALQARARALDDAALDDAYQALCADDDIIVSDTLKRLAYNDVVRERGLDEAACYGEGCREKLVALIA
ncbi:hypothetical protein [Aromatoleum aromaticum]|uniref:hypothetical protein n=1 Tax=Aromatoleum aromaticum TaxID=551760 RepID=UPI0002E449CD|nr:hypothetical protein [Aromatoleum aromaticum]